MNEQSQNPVGNTREQVKQAMHGLEAWLAPLFQKFPHIPEGGRKTIVDIMPWLALIFGILGVLSLLSIGGIGILLSIFTFGVTLPMMLYVVISLVGAVLLLMSYPGLKAKKKNGWNLAFYSQVVYVIGGVVGIVLGGYMSNVLGIVLGAVVGFWLLFEVRSYYS